MSKVLTYDIECIGVKGWTWGLYDQNVYHIEHYPHLLSIAYKWLDKKKVHCLSLPKYDLYKKDPHSDKVMAEEWWEILNEADVVIGWNNKSFDDKMVNDMLKRHKMPPPLPYYSVDLMRERKRVGRSYSNKLNDATDREKIKHDPDLFIKCDSGVMSAWNELVKYNKRDVELTEQNYLENLPWIKNHPALNVLDGIPNSCGKCGSKKFIRGAKYATTKINRYQYCRCSNCGDVVKVRLPEKLDKPDFVSV